MPNNKSISIPRGGSSYTRKILRKETNFGCAICGRPYLTYHHFDPPWRKKPHDNPEGMIALCSGCAAQADGGAYTKNQLHNYKRHSFLAGKKLSSYFNWRRKDFLYLVGGNFSVGCNTLIQANNQRVIWQEHDTDSGTVALSFKILNRNGGSVLEMFNNQWDTDPNLVSDVDSSFSGNKLTIRSKSDDSWFRVWFRNTTQDRLRNILKMGHMKNESEVMRRHPGIHGSVNSNTAFDDKLINDLDQRFGQIIPLCILEGIFYLPERVKLGKYGIVLPRGGYMGMNYFVGSCATAFNFADTGIQIG